jgi:GNAT superfamily N-acetyltransferase
VIIDTIRTAIASDAHAVARLVNSAYRPVIGAGGWTHESDLVAGDRTSPEQVTALIRKPNTVLLIGLVRNEIAASALIEQAGRISLIGMLAVQPVQQATGIGKRILAEAEHYAITHFGAEMLRMNVLSTRSELLAFYVRRGYCRTGVLLDYPNNTDVGTPKRDDLKIVVLEKLKINI